MTATASPSSVSRLRLAPGEVSPGHMMLAPERTNRMAPLSTCWWGRISGYLCRSWRKTGLVMCKQENKIYHQSLIDRNSLLRTTLQSMMNAKLSLHGFWHCHEKGLIRTIQLIPHNLYVSFKLAFLYCGLTIILVYPNPQ